MYSNHRTCIFVSYFMGTFIYAGTINRPLRLLTVCDNAADGLLIMLRSPTKLVANIPPGVGADSSCPYPCVTKTVYLRNPKCIFPYPKLYLHIIKCVHSFYHTHISVCHFVGVYVYAGAINRPLRLRTDCQNIANGLPFCGCFHICGHDKSAPTAADGLPKHC